MLHPLVTRYSYFVTCLMHPLIESVFGPRVRRVVLILGLVLLLGWLLFFDSHSVWERFDLHRQHRQLVRENAALEERVDRLEEDLEHVHTDKTVERVAREQYGMRREGETIYRAAPDSEQTDSSLDQP